MMGSSNVRALLVLCVAALLCAGCSNATNKPGKNTYQLEQFLLEGGGSVQKLDYTVLPTDVLAVNSETVLEVENQAVTVSPRGTVYLPLLGELYVAEMQTDEIEKVLEEAAREYYEEVDIHVRVTGYNSQRIYLFGQLGGGSIAYTGNNSIFDVLDSARPNELAWETRVLIIRPRQPYKGGFLRGPEDWEEYRRLEEAGTKVKNPYGAQVVTVDFKKMYRKGDLSRNVMLKPNDIVYVPPSPTGWIVLKIRDLLRPVSPVLEAVRTPSTVENSFETLDDAPVNP